MPNNAKNFPFQVVRVEGKEALFIQGHLDRSTVPDGLHLYDVGCEKDSFEYGHIAHHLRERHAGTLLVKEPLGVEDGATKSILGTFEETTERKNLLEYLSGQRFVLGAVSETEAALLHTLRPSEDRAAGGIGHIQGKIDDQGTMRWQMWISHTEPALRDAAFVLERELVLALMEEPLFTPDAIRKFCAQHPEAALEGQGEQFGFRADTESRAYLVRFVPEGADYNVHLYTYDKAQLDQYLKQQHSQMPELTTIKYYSPLSTYVWMPDPDNPSEYGWVIRQEVKVEDSPDTQELIRENLNERHPGFPGELIHWYKKDDPVKRKIESARLDIEMVGGTLWAVGVCEATESLTEAQERNFKKFWQGILHRNTELYTGRGISTEFGTLYMQFYSDDPDWCIRSEAEMEGPGLQMGGQTL